MDEREKLEGVLTISEVAALWQRHPVSIRRAFDSRKRPLVARKSEHIWLISYESCLRRWGPPRKWPG